MAIDDKDKQVWDLITDVPKLGKLWAVLCLILNIIIPGMSEYTYSKANTITTN